MMKVEVFPKILLLEDEEHIREGLKLNLELNQYQVFVAETIFQAKKIWDEVCVDLIVLDLMLPDGNGFDFLSYVRTIDEKLPVLILSAKNQVQMRVQGFSLGGDDYITKPFHLDEFLCRLQTLLKKAKWYEKSQQSLLKLDQQFLGLGDSTKSGLSENNPKIYRFGENLVNLETGEAIGIAGKFQLTAYELKLVNLFVSSPGKLFEREQILFTIWNYSEFSHTRTLDNFMARLRKYFEKDPKNPQFFLSRRSRGYFFQNLNDPKP